MSSRDAVCVEGPELDLEALNSVFGCQPVRDKAPHQRQAWAHVGTRADPGTALNAWPDRGILVQCGVGGLLLTDHTAVNLDVGVQLTAWQPV